MVKKERFIDDNLAPSFREILKETRNVPLSAFDSLCSWVDIMDHSFKESNLPYEHLKEEMNVFSTCSADTASPYKQYKDNMCKCLANLFWNGKDFRKAINDACNSQVLISEYRDFSRLMNAVSRYYDSNLILENTREEIARVDYNPETRILSTLRYEGIVNYILKLLEYEIKTINCNTGSNKELCDLGKVLRYLFTAMNETLKLNIELDEKMHVTRDIIDKFIYILRHPVVSIADELNEFLYKHFTVLNRLSFFLYNLCNEYINRLDAYYDHKDYEEKQVSFKNPLQLAAFCFKNSKNA